MFSSEDDTVLLVTPSKPSTYSVYATDETIDSLTLHIDEDRSGILLDNTTLYTAYRVIAHSDRGVIPPHYLLDLAIVATAVSFFDVVYFIQRGPKQDWHDLFCRFLTDKDDRVFVGIPLPDDDPDEKLHWALEQIYHWVHALFGQPVIVEGYKDSWEYLLGYRPEVPSSFLWDSFLQTPKQPLQVYADEFIEEGYSVLGKTPQITRRVDRRMLDNFCYLSSSKAVFYSTLAEKLGIPYLANSLRGASLMGSPIASVRDNEAKLLADTSLVKAIGETIQKDIKSARIVRDLCRMPLPLSALFHHKLEAPSSTLLDSLQWLRQHTVGYRKTIHRFLDAVVRRRDPSLREAEMASAILAGDFSDWNYAYKGGALLKIVGTILKSIDELKVAGALLDALSIIATGEDLQRSLVRFHSPYLHVALSLKDSAKECIDLEPAYAQIFGAPYPEVHLKQLERISEFHPLVGF